MDVPVNPRVQVSASYVNRGEGKGLDVRIRYNASCFDEICPLTESAKASP